MLLHRYHNIDYVMQLPAEDGLALIAKAMEKDHEERLFQQWVAQLPLMAVSGDVEGFEDYKARVTGANIDRRSTAEIMAELDEVERALREGGNC